MEAIINNKRNRTIKYTEDNSIYSVKYIEYRRQWNYNPIDNVVNKYPIHLDIEVNNNCQLACKMCFQSYAPPKKVIMPFKRFKKIIDDAAKGGVMSIKMMYRGEPLLHPDIIKMVKYAKDKGIIEVMFNTNANLLTEKMSRDLINAGLDRLICSVDGYTKKVYESIRIGGNFDLVVRNIKAMQKIKKELKSETPKVRVQMLIFDTMKNSDIVVKKYKKYWSPIVDDIGIDYCNDYHEDSKRDIMICKDFKCTSPWQRLFIMADGEIRLCCGDIYGKMSLGHINKNRISDIWTSPLLKFIRKLHCKGESHKMLICNECGGRRTLIKNKKVKK